MYSVRNIFLVFLPAQCYSSNYLLAHVDSPVALLITAKIIAASDFSLELFSEKSHQICGYRSGSER